MFGFCFDMDFWRVDGNVDGVVGSLRKREFLGNLAGVTVGV